VSNESALARLARSLGRDGERVADLERFAALSEAQLDALTVAVDNTAARQKAALDQAITDSLEHVPRLLRGAVKRVLGLATRA